MEGSATLVIEASRTTTNWAEASRPSASHLRRSAVWVSVISLLLSYPGGTMNRNSVSGWVIYGIEVPFVKHTDPDPDRDSRSRRARPACRRGAQPPTRARRRPRGVCRGGLRLPDAGDRAACPGGR